LKRDKYFEKIEIKRANRGRQREEKDWGAQQKNKHPNGCEIGINRLKIINALPKAQPVNFNGIVFYRYV